MYLRGSNVKAGPPPVGAPERSDGAATGGRAEPLVGRLWVPGQKVRCGLFLVMITARKNPDLFVVNLIDETVFFINAFRPAARQFMFQRFRLADAAERFGASLLNDPHQADCLLPVVLNPPRQVFER